MNFRREGVEFDWKILVLGDLHHTWNRVNFLLAKHRPEIVLQCGDFGWWEKWHNTHTISHGTYRRDPITGIKKAARFNQYGLHTSGAKLYWCPGNHEDWEDLDLRATSESPKPVKMFKDVYYMPRCSTLELPDSRRVLFMGGAKSTDKSFRRMLFDWFPMETISDTDIRNLPEVPIDIIISHTSPGYFKQELYENINDWRRNDSYWLEKFRDPSCHALNVVWEKYRPKLWFFGHYHMAKSGRYRGCSWHALNKLPDPGWWMPLPKE